MSRCAFVMIWICFSDLSMRIPIKYVDRAVFFYRKHDGNISANEELRVMENIKVIEKFLSDFPGARVTSLANSTWLVGSPTDTIDWRKGVGSETSCRVPWKRSTRLLHGHPIRSNIVFTVIVGEHCII